MTCTNMLMISSVPAWDKGIRYGEKGYAPVER